MKIQLNHNSKLNAYSAHPVEAMEPSTGDCSVVMTTEAYNRITHWILDGGTFEKIGVRASCIHRCAGRSALPSAGLFEPLETASSRVLAKKMLCVVLGWVVRGRTLEDIGRRALAAFSAIRQDLSGEKALAGIGARMGCTKQAVSGAQKRFRKRMGIHARAIAGQVARSKKRRAATNAS